MRQLIPAAVLSICAEVFAKRESHATLDSLFIYAGATGEPPPGSKHAKALAWLRNTNKDETINPLDVLGRLIENYMEFPLDPVDFLYAEKIKDIDRIKILLANNELQYAKGGKIIGALGAPSRTLEEFIKDRDFASIDTEFTRALSNVHTSPRDAVSAASNILESVCKVYISEENLEMPSKQDLRTIWAIVRKHLGFDPGVLEDKDLQQILSGLIAVTDGIGSLRTHASSAHGAGKTSYKLEPRHARLAIHSAHTVALFVLESWSKKRA
ncbi:MAG TPA: abortive infection family protein [Methylotenera sp.]